MKLHKSAALVVLSLALFSSLSALEVDREEIRRTNGEVVEFQNYNGPHAIVESASSITGIGNTLGRQVAGKPDSQGTYSANGSKYSVIHAYDASETGKYDADILFVNDNASVDHIRNLRRIIAGYLSSAYGYSSSDASTLAVFVTVYNAVYRGQLDVFKARYKNAVTKHLSAKDCGLSTRWSDWPGHSQIVIPLFDINSDLSAVDTSVISDKKVVDSMREEDDRGVDERKNLVDIKEREAEQYSDKAQKEQETADAAKKDADSAQKKADDAKKTADTAQKTADNAQKKADDAQKSADTAQKKADDAKKAAQEDPNNKTKQQAATTAQKNADAAQKKADEAQKSADNAQKKADDAKKTADNEQKKADSAKQTADNAQKTADSTKELADKKQSEAQQERTEIAKDQQKILLDALENAANKNNVIGLKRIDDELSGMVKVDSTTGLVVKESPVTVIRGRMIYPAASGSSDNGLLYVAICGDKGGIAKLCLLDANKMEIQAESNEVVSNNSTLVKDGNDYYCVIKDGSKNVIAKYDSALNLLLKSPVEVLADTPITVTSAGVIATAADKSVVLLGLKDLKQISLQSKAVEATKAASSSPEK